VGPRRGAKEGGEKKGWEDRDGKEEREGSYYKRVTDTWGTKISLILWAWQGAWPKL